VRDGKPGKGHPSIAHGNLAIRRMGERTGAYDAVFSNDVSMFRPEKLKQFDAVCFNNTVGVLFDDPELRKSLLDFVAGGKGFVGIHAAAATFVQWPRYDQWPQFGEMLGGYENGGHPWKPNETITLKVEAANHPINAAFGGRGFEISDEVFQFQQPYSRDKLRVLLSIDTTRTDMSPSRRFLPERAADKDFAISWVRRYGEGRVFYSSLGHNPHIFWNPAVLEHFLAGIQFALGDLEADAKPSRQLAGPAARSVGDPLPRATAAAAKPASSGGDWFPLQPVKDDFGPSVLDCSRFVEAPTGRHGFVTVRQDRFVFEDGTPARFWGAQMNMFRKEQLDYTVRRMRRQGINITRMHGMDYSRRGAETSFDYSPESFDRLDYLLAKLGEHGIYMILDIHYPLTYRFKPGDGIPGLPKGGPAPYTQFFNEKAAAVMQRRMADFFTHLNPYTKKRYADDPTLAMVEILNEDSLFWGQVPETFRAELEGKFAAWLKKKYGDLAGLKKAWTAGGKSPLAEGEGLGPAERIRLIANPMFTEKYFLDRPEQRVRGQDQMRFYLELEDKYWADCRAVLRKAGVRVPISATNWQGHGFPTRVHMLGQARLDYIDRHGYWDHPQGEGNLKWNIRTALFHNQPMVKAVNADQDRLVYLGVGNLVIEKAWEQVLGLPMTVSEWNTCVPNQYSLEGPGLMAAYGLLQGWDGPLEFGYFSPDWRNTMGPGSFDLFGNPPQILQFPAIAALWHRQDVREADVVAESLYDPESVFALTEDRKPLPIAAALVGKVGYRFVQGPRKPVVKEIGKNWDPKTLTARSITGELTWNGSDGVVTIDAPRTQAVIGFLGKAEHALGTVRIKSPTDFGAVYVTAMDGDEPVRSARRILITAVGRAKNTGMEYELASKTSRRGGPQWHLKSVGQAPVLLESVAGQIEIRSSHAGQLKAWVLDVVGKRLHEVPLTRKGDRVILDVQPQHKTVYYDLAAE
jgi:type 1 glutamine amidotransferase